MDMGREDGFHNAARVDVKKLGRRHKSQRANVKSTLIYRLDCFYHVFTVRSKLTQ